MGVIYVEDDFNPDYLISDLNKVFKFKNEMYLEIDLENFHDITMLNNLIGSSKGYVGFEQGGILSEHLIKYPMSLIFLKNFNSAHQSIQNFFKTLFKKPFFLDNKDRKIYLINTIFIISNPTLDTHLTGFIHNIPYHKITKLKTIQKNQNMNNANQMIKKYGISIQNIEKIPNEKLPDIIVDALLKNAKHYLYNTDSASIEEVII